MACLAPAQFGRLERVEVGGTKGKSLTSAIKQVHTDFLAAHEKFQQVRAVAKQQSKVHAPPAANKACYSSCHSSCRCCATQANEVYAAVQPVSGGNVICLPVTQHSSC